MSTEDRRALIKELETKTDILHARGGRDVELAEEIDKISSKLYPDGEDEVACPNCGVTYIEMSDFDDYHAVKYRGRCLACKEPTKSEFLVAFDDHTWDTFVEDTPEGIHPDDHEALRRWAEAELLTQARFRNAALAAVYCSPFPAEGE